MRFPAKFSRFKGGGGTPALGSDTVPTGNVNQDNILYSKFTSINGWPASRVAVVYKAPSGSLALNADMYFFEENIGMWFKITASPVALTPGRVTFFDVVALMDLPNTLKGNDDPAPSSGSIAQMLIVSDPGAAPNGEHIFAMGPDLTTTP